MDSSKFGFRPAILALFVGFVALQVLTTVRKSLRLTTFLGNDATLNLDYYSERILPSGKAPWLRQERNKTTTASSIKDPPTDDDSSPTSSPTSATSTMSPTATDHFNNPAADTKNAIGGKYKSSTGTAKQQQQQQQQWPKRWTSAWMDNVPHFFSHIPKSGAEYAHQELIHLLQSTVRMPDNRTIYSVRKAQKRFNETSYEGDFLESNPKYEHENFPIPVDTAGETDGYTPPFICNQGTTEFRHLKPYHVVHNARYRCDFFVTEHHWNPAAHNVYTIVREPFSHVLSQYFHCTESRDHKRTTGNRPEVTNRQNLMPPLNEWLKLYADFADVGFTPKELYEHTKLLKRRFSCYDPIESESEFTQFNHKLPKDYTYPYPYTNDHGDRDEKTKQLDKVIFDDLKQKYRVIGDTSQMVKSVCAIFIAYIDGKHIPETCDCTNPRVSDSNSSQFYVHDLYKDPEIEMFDEHNYKIKMGFNPIHHSHGVKNHGSTFLKELPQDQLDLIAKLRRKDQVLYNVSRAVFAEQIKEMEASYGIKVCDQWNRPKQPKRGRSPRWNIE